MLDAGATDVEVCEMVACSEATLYAYLRREPSFLKPRKEAKDHADARVEKSLFKRANGYETEEITTTAVPGKDENGRPIAVPVKIVKTKSRVAPDTAAAIFWLKNRKRDQWRDRHELGVSGAVSLADLIGAATAPEDGGK
jgi:hypothetical protein